MRRLTQILTICLVAMITGLGGCGTPPRAHTTFLRSVDLVSMTDEMSMSFAQDDRLQTRSAADDRWVISIDRIVNHTNQIIPTREKWLYIARLRAQLAQSRIADDKAIVWVIPPERWADVADELGQAPDALRMTPTHVLTGTFEALTSTSGRGRTDTVVCAYSLNDLRTGQIIWEDHWEVKRRASGITYD